MLTLICQKIKTARDLDHAHLGQFVIAGLLRAGGKNPVPLVGRHGASQLYWGTSNSLAPALSVCGHLTAEKRNRLCKKLTSRAFLKMNTKFYD